MAGFEIQHDEKRPEGTAHSTRMVVKAAEPEAAETIATVSPAPIPSESPAPSESLAPDAAPTLKPTEVLDADAEASLAPTQSPSSSESPAPSESLTPEAVQTAEPTEVPKSDAEVRPAPSESPAPAADGDVAPPANGGLEALYAAEDFWRVQLLYLSINQEPTEF